MRVCVTRDAHIPPPVIDRPYSQHWREVCVTWQRELYLEDLAEVGVAASGLAAVAGLDGMRLGLCDV